MTSYHFLHIIYGFFGLVKTDNNYSGFKNYVKGSNPYKKWPNYGHFQNLFGKSISGGWDKEKRVG
jgi:hypothetical protein